MAQEMGLGCVEKSLRLPGQFRAVAAETRCHFLDANALGLAHNPIDFMHLTRESRRAGRADSHTVLNPYRPGDLSPGL